MRLATRVLLLLAAGALGANDAGAQNRVPPGYEEGLFDLAIVGIAPTSVPVLVSPRGKFLLPVRALLDPLGVPYDIIADSALLRVSRPAGVGRASLWWGASRRLEVTAITPVDSDDVYVDG